MHHEQVEEIKAILKQLAYILHQTQNPDRARMIEDDVALLDVDLPKAIEQLGGLEYWGGSGSHVDYIIESRLFASEEERIVIELEWRRVLLVLVNILIDAGVKQRRFDFSKRGLESSIRYWTAKLDAMHRA